MKQDLSSPVKWKPSTAWAEVYDTQPNPLLALEERVLGSMMPNVRGLDVLDAGCGTGRWLQRLLARSPRSLLGVDISPAMLLLAGIKLSQNCSLRLGSCTALPVNDTACDMVLIFFRRQLPGRSGKPSRGRSIELPVPAQPFFSLTCIRRPRHSAAGSGHSK